MLMTKCDRLSRCGGVIGLYFLVKRCCLLYLYASNGTFTLAPYLDIHGEVDTSMR
jgi:E3 ubiquitin-protein ligase UBR1